MNRPFSAAALLPPPEHNRGTAKHIGTAWIRSWNICSVPSLRVNCCVESGPGTASLSRSLRSAAGGRSLRGLGLAEAAGLRSKAGPAALPAGGSGIALLGSRAAAWLALLLPAEGMSSYLRPRWAGRDAGCPAGSAASPRLPGEQRSRAPHLHRSPSDTISATLETSPAWEARLIFLCILWWIFAWIKSFMKQGCS